MKVLPGCCMLLACTITGPHGRFIQAAPCRCMLMALGCRMQRASKALTKRVMGSDTVSESLCRGMGPTPPCWPAPGTLNLLLAVLLGVVISLQ